MCIYSKHCTINYDDDRKTYKKSLKNKRSLKKQQESEEKKRGFKRNVTIIIWNYFLGKSLYLTITTTKKRACCEIFWENFSMPSIYHWDSKKHQIVRQNSSDGRFNELVAVVGCYCKQVILHIQATLLLLRIILTDEFRV